MSLSYENSGNFYNMSFVQLAALSLYPWTILLEGTRVTTNRILSVLLSPQANVCSYLQLVALAEGSRLTLSDAHDLLRLSAGDVRRCLLQLQLWASSSAGQELRRTRGWRYV